MNQEVKQIWIEALESGKFKKGKTTLYNKVEDTYCCLGVACVLYNKHNNLNGQFIDGMNFMYDHGTLVPKEVSDWLGIDNKDTDGTQGLLAQVNDANKTFDPVIDIIKTL